MTYEGYEVIIDRGGSWQLVPFVPTSAVTAKSFPVQSSIMSGRGPRIIDTLSTCFDTSTCKRKVVVTYSFRESVPGDVGHGGPAFVISDATGPPGSLLRTSAA